MRTSQFREGDKVVCINKNLLKVDFGDYYYVIATTLSGSIRVTNKLAYYNPESFVLKQIWDSPLYQALL